MTDLKPIREALGFFASVIKSGEPWTLQCEASLSVAIARLDAIEEEFNKCGNGAGCCHMAATIDALTEKLAAIENADGETPCPKREDKQHCNCWYDGEKCCVCGAPASCASETATTDNTPIGSFSPPLYIHGPITITKGDIRDPGTWETTEDRPPTDRMSMSDEEILALPFADRVDCEKVAQSFIVNEKFTPFGTLSSCKTKDEAGAIVRLGSGVIRRARLDGFKAALAMSVPERNKMRPDEWPANIVADRHEVSGKWVLSYLTDEQAGICKRALPALAEEQCGICGDYHEGIIPRGCETGDGE